MNREVPVKVPESVWAVVLAMVVVPVSRMNVPLFLRSPAMVKKVVEAVTVASESVMVRCEVEALFWKVHPPPVPPTPANVVLEKALSPIRVPAIVLPVVEAEKRTPAPPCVKVALELAIQLPASVMSPL